MEHVRFILLTSKQVVMKARKKHWVNPFRYFRKVLLRMIGIYLGERSCLTTD